MTKFIVISERLELILGFFITRECKKDHKCKQVFCQTIIGTGGGGTRDTTAKLFHIWIEIQNFCKTMVWECQISQKQPISKM